MGIRSSETFPHQPPKEVFVEKSFNINQRGDIKGHPEAEVSQEKREKNRIRDVVRVVPLQSKKAEDFSGLTLDELQNAYLVHTVLIEKNKKSFNPGDAMQPGGKMEEGENVLDTAKRELEEETSIPLLSGITILGKEDYELKKKGLQLRARFVGTKISYRETFHQLDPDEDKISTFHRFDLPQIIKLSLDKKLDVGGKNVFLLDSLYTEMSGADSVQLETEDEKGFWLEILSNFLENNKKRLKQDVRISGMVDKWDNELTLLRKVQEESVAKKRRRLSSKMKKSSPLKIRREMIEKFAKLGRSDELDEGFKMAMFPHDARREEQAGQIKQGIMDYMGEAEAEKKADVLKKFLSLVLDKLSGPARLRINKVLLDLRSSSRNKAMISNVVVEEYDEAVQELVPKMKEEITQVFDLVEMQRLWKETFEILKNAGLDEKEIMNKFMEAVNLSNFREEVVSTTASISETDAVLRFVNNLAESGGLTEDYLEAAKENPKLKDFVFRFRKFLDVSGGEKYNTNKQSEEMGKILRDEVLGTLVGEEFIDIFDIGNKKEGARGAETTEAKRAAFNRRTTYINDLINSIVDITEKQASAIQKRKASRSAEGKIAEDEEESEIGLPERPWDEIQNGSIETLLQYAFPDKKDLTPKEKNYRFEALRHLGLLYLLTKADQYMEKTVALGRAPVEAIFQKILVSEGDKKLYFENQFDADGKLLDVQVSKPDDARGTAKDVRQMKSIDGKNEYLVEAIIGKKSLSSLYRKIIEHGLDEAHKIHDINRRALIIHDCELTRENIDDRNMLAQGLVKVDRNVKKKDRNELPAVLDVMQRIVEEGNVGGSTVRILKYKPTLPPNRAMISSSAGGGAEIRLAKFEVEHTDKNGEKRYEEVQVFTPSLDGRSAAFWYEQKKEDDKRYEFARLFESAKDLSVIRKLFPEEFYPNLERLYHEYIKDRKEQKNLKKKKKKK